MTAPEKLTELVASIVAATRSELFPEFADLTASIGAINDELAEVRSLLTEVRTELEARERELGNTARETRGEAPPKTTRNAAQAARAKRTKAPAQTTETRGEAPDDDAAAAPPPYFANAMLFFVHRLETDGDSYREKYADQFNADDLESAAADANRPADAEKLRQLAGVTDRRAEFSPADWRRFGRAIWAQMSDGAKSDVKAELREAKTAAATA